MSRSRFTEFEVTYPDGCIVHRLPVGLAAGRWWVSIALTNVPGGDNEDDEWLIDVLSALGRAARVRLSALDGQLVEVGGGAGGDGEVFGAHCEFEANGVDLIRVEYLHDGTVIAEEEIELR